jgi:CheY-like chemotaxis protein
MQLVRNSTSFEEEEKGVERPIVLVIDNQAAILDMLSCMLYLQGYQPACVSSGQEALEWIKNALLTGKYPAVILLDLRMPVMDGASFLTHFRTQWNAPVPIPPVILLTVDKGNHDDLACFDVLLKPFHLHDLREMLDRITGKEPAVW